MKTLIKKVLKKLLSLRKIDKVLFGRNAGLRFKYNDDLNLDMMLGLHEPNTFEVFRLFIKKGMVVADIGANVGYFSRFLSRAAGENGKLIAFEPIPQTFQRLADTVQLNGLKNVTLVDAAVGDKNGCENIFLSGTHYMASLDSTWAGKSGGEIEVKSIRLDSYFEELGFYPDFIKMDIEGGGVYALPGMKNCIIKNEPILLLESHTSSEDIAIGKALSLIPYEVYRVGDPRDVKYLDKDYTDGFGIYGTVIAVPKSKLNSYGNWNPKSFQRKRIGQR